MLFAFNVGREVGPPQERWDSVLDYLHAEGVALVDFLDEVEALRDLAKAGVVAVEVGGVFAVVDDEELRAASVSACMGHAQHTFVVELVVSVELAVDGVARSSAADALRHPPWATNPGITRWNFRPS